MALPFLVEVMGEACVRKLGVLCPNKPLRQRFGSTL
jgi:hypothetical protein